VLEQESDRVLNAHVGERAGRAQLVDRGGADLQPGSGLLDGQEPFAVWCILGAGSWESRARSRAELGNSLVEIRCYVGRGERIRTSDILVPNQARYQAALRPETARRLYVI
jgi:hypothetical protein